MKFVVKQQHNTTTTNVSTSRRMLQNHIFSLKPHKQIANVAKTYEKCATQKMFSLNIFIPRPGCADPAMTGDMWLTRTKITQ